MHTVFAPLVFIFSMLTGFCTTLSTELEQFVSRPWGMFSIAAIVVTSLVLAAGGGGWAILERARRGIYRERVQAVLRRSQIARHFRDTILESLPETVVVLRSRSQQALSYGGGSALLQQCLDGPDPAPLAVAINDLLRRASGFSLSVRLSSARQVFVRGLRIGNGAALFLRAQESYSAKETIGSGTPRTARLPTANSLNVVRGAGARVGTDNVRPIRASRDGEIIIGPDGRLKQYNRAFAMQWSLSDDALRGEPLWSEIAEQCAALHGRDAIWHVISCAATAAEPERLKEWGAMIGNDGARVALSFSRLKDGSTRVMFADATHPSEAPAFGTRAEVA